VIRYPITDAELRRRIEAEKPGWLARSQSRTESFRIEGDYKESSTIWSEIKGVYLELQGNCKCAFCERSLESNQYGKIEQDVEHFRPKGAIRAWKVPAHLKRQGITPGELPAVRKGYHLLPYNIFNYATACKPCNSILKKDYFPIAGVYQTNGDDPRALQSELPYLIYPIGEIDEDPEKIIEFYGTSPRPASQEQHMRERALVTIEFFKLDEPQGRKNLFRERSLVLMGLYPLLQKTLSASITDRSAAQATVDSLLVLNLPHLNCAKSFKRLFARDPAEAKSVYDAAVQFMSSKS
jgi:hypothetical protein